jgi:hypothetical protein
LLRRVTSKSRDGWIPGAFAPPVPLWATLSAALTLARKAQEARAFGAKAPDWAKGVQPSATLTLARFSPKLLTWAIWYGACKLLKCRRFSSRINPYFWSFRSAFDALLTANPATDFASDIQGLQYAWGHDPTRTLARWRAPGAAGVHRTRARRRQRDRYRVLIHDPDPERAERLIRDAALTREACGLMKVLLPLCTTGMEA